MRNLITTVSLAVAVFIAQPIQAQYSGNDDTTKVQETLVEKPKKSGNNYKHPLHPFQKEAMTFTGIETPMYW